MNARTEVIAPKPISLGAFNAGELVHVSADEPGLRRRRRGHGFAYLDHAGTRVEDAAILDRVRSLGIPPAWTDVWICGHPAGHLQATGRDAKGRKQYVYHPVFRELRDRTKFDHLLDFAAALPALRARVAADLAARGVTRERVLATVVALLERTLIRVGNEEYVRQAGSYGLTTLRDPHVKVAGAELRFVFKGKSGKEWNLRLRDRRLARLVKDCQDIPGQHLFQYYTEAGERRAVTSADVNAYLVEISGKDITAKDFRTWHGTVLAAAELSGKPAPTTKAEANRTIRDAILAASTRLGNTPTICRKCYVHPAVLDAYLAGEGVFSSSRAIEGLSTDEAALVAFLKRRAA